MIDTEPHREDSHAFELSLALDRAGVRKDLADSLRRLPGTTNDGHRLALIHRAEAVLALKAAEVMAVPEPVAELETVETDEAIEPVEEPTAKVTTEDEPEVKAAVSSSEMPSEVKDHLAKHKRMMGKYGAGPMSEWAAEMGIEKGEPPDAES